MSIYQFSDLIPRLHDRANIEQTSSKKYSKYTCWLLDVCSTFAWCLLDVC